MHFDIRTIGDPTFILTGEVSPGLAAFNIPGSKALNASGTFGNCLIQLIDTGNVGFLYAVFKINREVLFQLSIFGTEVICRIALQKTIGHRIQTLENLYLKEGEFTVIKCGAFNNTFCLEKSGVYSFVDIFYPADYILLELKHFPGLNEFEEKIKSPNAVIVNAGAPVNAVIMDLLYKLLHAPFSLAIKQFHVDIIKEILFEIFKQAAKALNSSPKFSVQKIEAIHAAKEFIDAKLPHHFSISKIARRAGINERMLKMGFREIYGTGLYTYLHNQILEIAKKQLEETNKSVKEIAFEAGYRSANNFSAAFKKKFGKAPLTWREKFR